MLSKSLRKQIYQLTKYPEIKWVKLFGSRSRGDAGNKSDYDLAIFAKNLDSAAWAKIEDLLKSADLYGKDIVNYAEASEAICAQIDRDGKLVFIPKSWFITFSKLEDAFTKLQKYVSEPEEDEEKKRAVVIFHFIFVIELMWKLFKQLLEEFEDVEVGTPRQSFEQAFAAGWINDAKAWSDMMRDRNESVHSYDDELSIKIFNNIIGYMPELQSRFTYFSKMINEKAEIFIKG